jgi:hypothetical protein
MMSKLIASIHDCRANEQDIKQIHLEQFAAQQMFYETTLKIELPEVGAIGTVYGIPFVIEPFGSPDWWFDL